MSRLLFIVFFLSHCKHNAGGSLKADFTPGKCGQITTAHNGLSLESLGSV
jgi:hypothetical protein